MNFVRETNDDNTRALIIKALEQTHALQSAVIDKLEERLASREDYNLQALEEAHHLEYLLIDALKNPVSPERLHQMIVTLGSLIVRMGERQASPHIMG